MHWNKDIPRDVIRKAAQKASEVREVLSKEVSERAEWLAKGDEFYFRARIDGEMRRSFIKVDDMMSMYPKEVIERIKEDWQSSIPND